MSGQIREVAIEVLEPLVGRVMATVYVADAIGHLGRAPVEIGCGDVPAMCDMLRVKISPFAARPVVDQAMADIALRTGA